MRGGARPARLQTRRCRWPGLEHPGNLTAAARVDWTFKRPRLARADLVCEVSEAMATQDSGTVPVCLSFDVDADESWRVRAPGQPENPNLTQLSWGRFGIVRGLPRILGLLGQRGVHATFFVPGVVAVAHATAIRAIAQAGHEIGHHGYHHFAPTDLTPAEQEQELDRGITAIRRCAGIEPAGYRAPCWRMTEVTLRLLAERGFAYDSSMMGDDRPYMAPVGNTELLEIPVHWALDDAPHFASDENDAGLLKDPRRVFELWRLEVESAIAERRPTTLCFHPEVIGRAWTFDPFGKFVAELDDDPRVRLARCIDVAKAWAPSSTRRDDALRADLRSAVRETGGAT